MVSLKYLSSNPQGIERDIKQEIIYFQNSLTSPTLTIQTRGESFSCPSRVHFRGLSRVGGIVSFMTFTSSVLRPCSSMPALQPLPSSPKAEMESGAGKRPTAQVLGSHQSVRSHRTWHEISVRPIPRKHLAGGALTTVRIISTPHHLTLLHPRWYGKMRILGRTTQPF